MRVSEYYELGKSQPVLDFVDVDIYGDVRLFIDPRSLKGLNSDWGQRCVSLVQSYFQNVLNKIRDGQHEQAKDLLSALSEPNETHLGYSSRRSQGRGVGLEKADMLWERLKESEAVKKGLISDIEDAALFIDGISIDTISDITTVIIREPLIEFTIDMCNYYGINSHKGCAVRVWDQAVRAWVSKSCDLPITSGGMILLVPKSIVRVKSVFDAGNYFRYHVTPFLQGEELRAESSLVELLKSGRKRVTKKSIHEKYVGSAGKNEKRVNLDITLENPHILDQYRDDNKSRPPKPLSHEQISKATDTPKPNFSVLLKAISDTPRGFDNAREYHNRAEELLSALLYPAFKWPTKEEAIHDGRKVIDITYINIASDGFFYDLVHEQKITLNKLAVECKNYTNEIGNPELDQLTGRFNSNHGFFGLLLCREVSNRSTMERRCRDTVKDGRGYVVVLDDSDLKKMVTERVSEPDSIEFRHLKSLYNRII